MNLKEVIKVAKKVEMSVRLVGLAALTYVVLKDSKEGK